MHRAMGMMRHSALSATIAAGCVFLQKPAMLSATGSIPVNHDQSGHDTTVFEMWQAQLTHFWTLPPFRLSEISRFDMETYPGRALHFLDVLGDCSMLLITQSDWNQCEALLRAAKLGQVPDTETQRAALWRARKVESACIHPDTGELIPAPFRFCAFAPANLVICSGLLWASGVSLRASALWQWLNQSYNVAVNHFNRSSGSPLPERLVVAYIGATLSSVSIAVGLQYLGNQLKGGARLVRLCVPMVGVSVGAVVNLVATRSEEMREGVALRDEAGNYIGHSQMAANSALAQCSATRVAWTVALLTLAPLVSGLTLRALPATIPRAVSVAADLASSFVVIWLSVPLCIAIWPQHTSLPGEKLEKQFHHIKCAHFNKGL